jgi:hypothetical protein
MPSARWELGRGFCGKIRSWSGHQAFVKGGEREEESGNVLQVDSMRAGCRDGLHGCMGSLMS